MALRPENPVVGGTVLRRQAIESPNYVPGVSGWTINQDGSAEFNNLTIRGTFAGTNFVVNSSGEFFYSPSEAAGNLVLSNAPGAGVDSFGNHYLAGGASYAASSATAITAGSVSFYTGSLAAGWTFASQIIISLVDGHIILNANSEVAGTLTVDGNTTVTGNLTVTGTASINGSGSTASSGLPDGTVHGTSGAASAGTAHTHSPGSFAIGNGNHGHVL